MSERLFVTLGVAATLTGTFYLLKRWQRRKANASVNGLALEFGKPAVVYFSSPACSVCRTSQKPILENMRTSISSDRVQWMTVDASEQINIVRQWGVTMLPTTCIVSESGKVTHVNNGLVTEQQLRQQLFGQEGSGNVT